MKPARASLAIVAIVLALTSCQSGPAPPVPSAPSGALPGSPSAPTSTASASVPPTVSHRRIVVLVMENKEYDRIIGSPDAPYLNDLARRSTLLTRFFATTHPSLPNYLALIGGSTFGIDSNCTSCTAEGPSLVDQLDAQAIPWRAYMEGMPSPCYQGGRADDYAKKHDPFLYFESVTSDPARCANVVPFERLSADLRGDLAPFVWITPDLCHDMHSCSVSEGDRWLSQWAPRVLAALGPDGILILTFDEGDTDAGCCGGTAAGGHIVTIIAGPGARAGARLTDPVDHYSVLRLIEDNWGLAHLGEADSPDTPSIGGWEA